MTRWGQYLCQFYSWKTAKTHSQILRPCHLGKVLNFMFSKWNMIASSIAGELRERLCYRGVKLVI